MLIAPFRSQKQLAMSYAGFHYLARVQTLPARMLPTILSYPFPNHQGPGQATTTPGGVPPPQSPMARESIGLPFLLDFVSPRGGAAQAAGRRRQMGRYVAYTLAKGAKQVGSGWPCCRWEGKVALCTWHACILSCGRPAFAPP